MTTAWPFQPLLAGGAQSQATTETVTVDKWYQQGARQSLAVPVAAAILASGFAWSGFTPAPPAETVTVDKWLPAQTQPAREPERPRGAAGFTALAPDFVTADRWLPYPARPAVEARTPRAALAWTAFAAPTEDVTPDKWLAPILSPLRVAYVPRAVAPWVPIVVQVETITADKWLPQSTRPDYKPFFFGRQDVAAPPWDTTSPAVATAEQPGTNDNDPLRRHRRNMAFKRRNEERELERQLRLRPPVDPVPEPQPPVPMPAAGPQLEPVRDLPPGYDDRGETLALLKRRIEEEDDYHARALLLLGRF